MTNQSKTPAIGLDQVKAIAPYVEVDQSVQLLGNLV